MIEALEDTEVEVTCSQLDRSQVVEGGREVVVAAPGAGQMARRRLGDEGVKAGVTKVEKEVSQEVTHCVLKEEQIGTSDYYKGLLVGAYLLTHECN